MIESLTTPTPLGRSPSRPPHKGEGFANHDDGVLMFNIPISPALAWALLFVAGVLEIVWAVGLRYSDGFTRLGPSVITIAAMVFSVVLLGLSLKSIPLGTAYAIWVGIGAVGVAALGIWLFDESATFMRLASISLITLGIIGLKLVD